MGPRGRLRCHTAAGQGRKQSKTRLRPPARQAAGPSGEYFNLGHAAATVPYRTGGSACHGAASSVASVGAVDFSLPDLSRHIPASVCSRVGYLLAAAPGRRMWSTLLCVGAPCTPHMENEFGPKGSEMGAPSPANLPVDQHPEERAGERQGRPQPPTAPQPWLVGLAAPRCPDEGDPAGVQYVHNQRGQAG